MQTYQRFITLPEKLPQFWHCTVICSAPLSADWKAGLLLAMQSGKVCLGGRTVGSACKEEEHDARRRVLPLRECCGWWTLSSVAARVDRAEVLRRWCGDEDGAMREPRVGEARVL